MAVYDKDGNSLQNIYDKNGITLQRAYDKNGTAVFEPLSYDLSVMSFNVQWFKNINADANHIVKDAIARFNPDIIGFQEWEENYGVGTIDGYAPDVYLENIGYDVMVGNGATISNKNAIASKYQLFDASEVAFTQGYKFGYNKAYITFEGKTIACYSTHLYWTEAGTSIRASECADLLSDAENEEYAIIIGDFNTLALSVSDAEYADAIGLFEDAGYHVANGDVMPLTKTWYDGTTAESSTKSYPTDNIITSSNISIDRVVVDTTKLSAGLNQAIDHLPLIAQVSVY